MIKIALVDDHVVLRKSLAILIGMFKDFEIILQADNGKHFIDQLNETSIPEIVLIDITMPVMDGVETTKWLKQNYPGIKVLALSMINNEFIIIRMLKNGARGYILKDCDPAILKDALHQVSEKGYYYNELITPGMRKKENLPEDLPHMMFNEQELAFLYWACTEKSHKQIADEMKVSPRTVDGYRDSLFRKLNVTSRIGIAMYAIRTGIVTV
jgi:two-component system invasion response regulator UvrY